MNKRGVAPSLIVALSVIAALITIGSTLGILDVGSITGSGSYIERPVFYYDKCEATSGLKYSELSRVATNGQWLNKPSVSESYNVILKIDENTVGANILSYSICNQKVESDANCREYDVELKGVAGQTIKLEDIKNEEYVWIYYEVRNWYLKYVPEGEQVQYQVGYVPFGLRQYNVLSGSSNQINPNSCTYSYTPKDTILSEDLDKVSKPEGRTTDENTLQPNEVRWYVAGYLTSASPSFVLSYRGEDAWCRQSGSYGEIYAINEITTRGGTYKVASADYSDYLGRETCCPGATAGDKVCNDDFEWEMVAGSECSLWNSCGSANWVPGDSGELVRYSCDNGYCTKETQDVECASDFDCRDSNEVCDLNSYECVKANVNLNGQVIETIPDSEAECIDKGGKWVSKQSEESSFWSFVGLKEPEIIVEEYCDMGSGTNWTAWIVLAFLIAVGFFFWPQIYATLKTMLRKVGIKI